jgi:hypothetical protein
MGKTMNSEFVVDPRAIATVAYLLLAGMLVAVAFVLFWMGRAVGVF